MIKNKNLQTESISSTSYFLTYVNKSGVIFISKYNMLCNHVFCHTIRTPLEEAEVPLWLPGYL